MPNTLENRPGTCSTCAKRQRTNCCVYKQERNKFLRKGKAEIETVTSTAKLSTAGFEDYLEKIRRWAAVEHNCYIPLPNEIDYAT